MDALIDFLNWAWARHHNPLSWYIRPLFVLPFCYFAYKRSIWGVALTVVAVTSSMFWFPAPAAADPRVTAFLAMERQYVTGPLTVGKAAMTMLVPLWFIVLALSFWRRSWVGGFIVISVGTLLKIIWSFYFGGESAWAIIPPVALGFIVCAGILLYAFRRVVTGVEDRLIVSASRRRDVACTQVVMIAPKLCTALRDSSGAVHEMRSPGRRATFASWNQIGQFICWLDALKRVA